MVVALEEKKGVGMKEVAKTLLFNEGSGGRGGEGGRMGMKEVTDPFLLCSMKGVVGREGYHCEQISRLHDLSPN